MSEQEPPNDLLLFPFGIPEAFARNLPYHDDRRLLGIHTAGGRCTITDGVYSQVGAGFSLYGELLYPPQIQDWLDEHEIDLGSDVGPPTHWLLFDRAETKAYISPAEKARDKVITQRLHE